jgi:hypothetical protein
MRVSSLPKLPNIAWTLRGSIALLILLLYLGSRRLVTDPRCACLGVSPAVVRDNKPGGVRATLVADKLVVGREPTAVAVIEMDTPREKCNGPALNMECYASQRTEKIGSVGVGELSKRSASTTGEMTHTLHALCGLSSLVGCISNSTFRLQSVHDSLLLCRGGKDVSNDLVETQRLVQGKGPPNGEENHR